ncbi:outer membrane protein assembly factor BamB [Pseudomaricurvus alkylphenolicus]|jgi:outer membrane protein assembly factor BamB|uniref:outer membrane protein assembly factor BamB n=1 Tax=Pseudomaricurvus alkylphenolicus TaxID=1306991 RepID=UPI0014234AB5|nr:outer membrane protein assembly factor BamB [Pseudomaricurvus alkylphenolicus]NIB43959.1 outer membrane protein assembly factor BamB [Pseudomaricurvus alkylphenolicus]
MKRILIPALLALLAACSSNDEIDLEPAELVDFDATVKVDDVWSGDVGIGAGKKYTLLPTATTGDQLFAVDAEGLVKAFNLESGRVNWEVELETGVASGVGANQGQVFLGTLNGELLALDASDGAELWRAEVGGEVLAPPQSNGSEVVVQTLDGKIHGYSVGSGDKLWMYDNTIPALTLRGTATPVVTPTSVYAGFATGKILALDVKDGTLQWEQRVAIAQGRSELERVIDINAAPLLVGDILYSGSYQGRLVALNRGTGGGLWAKSESSYNNLASGIGYIFVTDADDKVKAYNATNGQLMWENDLLVRRKLGGPQTFGSYVAVADFEGYVHIMDQTNGEFVARRKVDGDGVRSPMLGVGDVLYVYGNSGELEALKVR